MLVSASHIADSTVRNGGQANATCSQSSVMLNKFGSRQGIFIKSLVCRRLDKPVLQGEVAYLKRCIGFLQGCYDQASVIQKFTLLTTKHYF